MSAAPTPSLAGLRVLDLGWIWAGPLVGAALAEMGADVVKVESAKRMDPYRMRGVERSKEFGDRRHEASPSFHKLNRSKRSLTLNLREEGGRDLLLRLAGEADLLLENFSAGTQERLGLGWERFKRQNPRLVVLSMSAGGQQGQWRDLRAYALVTSALAGYESLVAYDGEEPIGAPTFGVADPTVSSFGLLGALGAVHRARRTGKGCYVDLSGVEALMSVMPEAFLGVAHDGEDAPQPALELIVGDPDADEWTAFVVVDAAAWEALVAALDPPGEAPSWEEISGSATAQAGARAWIADQPPAAVLAAVEGCGAAIPRAPVLTVEKRNASAPIADLIGELEHPVTGMELSHPSPWGSWQEPRPAPLLGQHTDEVLRDWLDLSDEEIEALREAGILH